MLDIEITYNFDFFSNSSDFYIKTIYDKKSENENENENNDGGVGSAAGGGMGN